MHLPAPSFACPSGKMNRLQVPTVLPQPEKINPSIQSRTDRFLNDSEKLLLPDLTALSSSTALSLNVGIPLNTPLLQKPDLDQYAFLLAERVKQISGNQLASVWCTKRNSKISTISIDSAIPAQSSNIGQTATLITRRSYTKEQFKNEIPDAISGLKPIQDGPVALHISYVTGLPRTWANLWKPTIDGLGGLLGTRNSSEPRKVDAGRIVQLALHHRSDGPELGHSVQITVTASSIMPITL